MAAFMSSGRHAEQKTAISYDADCRVHSSCSSFTYPSSVSPWVPDKAFPFLVLGAALPFSG